jgi:hypothetical protein
MPNNSLEHSASGAGPEIRRQLRVKEKIGEPGKACEGAIPGRSLVPAAPWPDRQGRQARSSQPLGIGFHLFFA